MRNLLIYLFTGMFVFNVHANKLSHECLNHQCLAIVDAGSTGSRLHVYAYDIGDKHEPTGIKEVYSNKINPGFATLPLTKKSINHYLDQLFTKTSLQHISIYFYATGGMRLLPEQSQQAYYQLLREWFNAQSQWNLVDARTIDGTDEGIFGWLAVNYQLGRLDSKDKALINLMDIGGASIQITLPVSENCSIDKKDLYTINIYDRRLTLFTRSFLGLGMTEVIRNFQNDAACFPIGYTLPNDLIGQGDIENCQQHISQWFNTQYGINKLAKTVIPLSMGEVWYTIGAISGLTKTPPFIFEQNQFNKQALLEQADTKVCRQNWQDLKSQHIENPSLAYSCLMSAYSYGLLANGLNFHLNEKMFTLSESNFDWTMGAVLINAA